MIITRVTAKSFMAHNELDLEFPSRGVVLVTGPNGVGKSAVCEAVSVALWNKTLRGTDPWRPGEKGFVRVHVDDLVVERSVTKGGSKKLTWSRGGETVQFATSAKAQEALSELIGSHDVWRRCSVFSSSDAALFSLSTDAQRKQLLESLLGVDRFDAALSNCRADLKSAGEHLRMIRSRVERAEIQIEEKTQALADAEQALDAAPNPTSDVGKLEVQVDKLRAEIEKAREDRSKIHKELNRLRTEAGDARARAKQARLQFERLNSGECPTCGQPVGDDVLSPITTSVETHEIEASKFDKEIDKLDGLALGHDRVIEDAERKRFTLQGQIKETERSERLHKQLSLTVARVTGELERATMEREDGAQASLIASRDCAELEAVEQVLGLRGVRAQLLGKSLSGLEAVANAHLAQIAGPGFRLRLKPYAERKTGAIADAISLEVEGAGGGYGYKASSGGERRRIDIALLLALAQVAESARGLECGLLVLDECFDALDEEGVSAVSEIVQKMARDRPVMVISHNQSLVEHLSPQVALRVRVSKGGVRVS